MENERKDSAHWAHIINDFENDGTDDEQKVGNRGKGEKRKCFIKLTKLFRYIMSVLSLFHKDRK